MAQTDDHDELIRAEAIDIIDRLMTLLGSEDGIGFWMEYVSLTDAAPPVLLGDGGEGKLAVTEDTAARWVVSYDIREHFDISERHTTIDDTLFIERRVRPRPDPLDPKASD